MAVYKNNNWLIRNRTTPQLSKTSILSHSFFFSVQTEKRPIQQLNILETHNQFEQTGYILASLPVQFEHSFSQLRKQKMYFFR